MKSKNPLKRTREKLFLLQSVLKYLPFSFLSALYLSGRDTLTFKRNVHCSRTQPCHSVSRNEDKQLIRGKGFKSDYRYLNPALDLQLRYASFPSLVRTRG